jgi:Flp pilus assembly protein TadG
MPMRSYFSRRCSNIEARSRARRWLRNDRGSAAIEFAIVAVPFFMFVLGTLGIGLYFFATNSLEHGVEAAARQIRTGEAQTTNQTVGGFKELVCQQAGRSYIDCGKLRVLVQHAQEWASLTPQSCRNADGSMAASTGDTADILSDYTGGSSEIVLVTLCYEWDLARSFSFLKLGTGPDGSGPAVIQAATAFRVEPYSSAS